MKTDTKAGIYCQYLYTYTWVLLFIVILFYIDTILPRRVPYPIFWNFPYDPDVISYRHFWSVAHYKYCKSIPTKLVISGIILLFCIPVINRRFLDIAKKWISHAHNLFGRRISKFSVLISFLFFLLFWNLRSTNFDGDSVMIPKFIQSAIDQGQMLMLPDEILPSLANHFSYRFFSTTLNWDIETSIGFLSCLWGGMFIYLLIRMVTYLQEDINYQLTALLLFLFSGVIQVYFGDVENYALPYLTVTLYIYASIKYLSEDNYPIVIPTMLWVLSLLSHVLSFTFAPSIIYIWYYKNRKQATTLLIAIVIILAIIGIIGTVSLPVSRALHISNMLSLRTIMKKLTNITNDPLLIISNRLIGTLNEMIMVSLPSLMIVGYYIFFHLRKIDFKDRVIQISFINFLSGIFCLLLLGPFPYDWNLFAFVAISNLVLAIILFVKIPLERKYYYHFVIYLAISFFHTSILILSSHYNWG